MEPHFRVGTELGPKVAKLVSAHAVVTEEDLTIFDKTRPHPVKVEPVYRCREACGD